jgi:hypothetical protein
MEANKGGKEDGRKEEESKRRCTLIFLSTIFLSNRMFPPYFCSPFFCQIPPMILRPLWVHAGPFWIRSGSPLGRFLVCQPSCNPCIDKHLWK